MYDRYDQKQLSESIEIVSQLIEEEMGKLDDRPNNIFLGGFSQGCCLALSTFVKKSYPNGQLGGILGLSGMFALQVKDWSKDVGDIKAKAQVPVFLSHGTHDPMIPLHSAKLSYDHMKEHGLEFTFQEEYGLEHSLSMTTL